ncbi:MAG TPA: hypothetical protein PKO06_06995, partial [Candidatus Ozemobacteraceae bacterium]|nr:hypothetical protein [Candidatus Ozemobacteraceae bacterium]
MTSPVLPQEDTLTTQSTIYTLRKRWKLLVAIQLLFVLGGFYVYYITPKVYSISSSIGLDRPYAASNWQNYTVEKENQTIVRLLTSEDLLERAIASLSLPPETFREVKVNAKIPRDSNVVNVELEDYVPSRMPVLFQTMITLAEARASENIGSGWNTKVDFLRKQIKSAEEKLSEVDKQLQVFIQQEGVLGVADKLKEISQEAQALKQEQRQNEVELGIINEALDELRKKAKEMSKVRSSSSYDFSELNDLQRELIQLKREQVRLASLYQSDHPEMRTNADQIAMIKKMYDRKMKEVQSDQGRTDSSGTKDAHIFQRVVELETQQKSLAQKIRLATTLGDEKTQAFKAMASKLEEYSSLARKQKINEEMHSQLLAKLNETELEKDVKNVTFKVLSRPVVPTTPIRPRFLWTILWALAIGTVLGFIVIHTQETIASTFQTPEEAAEALGLTCLGIIPDFKHLFAKPYD